MSLYTLALFLHRLFILSGAAALVFTGAAGQLVVLFLGDKYRSDGPLFMFANWFIVPFFLASFAVRTGRASRQNNHESHTGLRWLRPTATQMEQRRRPIVPPRPASRRTWLPRTHAPDG